MVNFTKASLLGIRCQNTSSIISKLIDTKISGNLSDWLLISSTFWLRMNLTWGSTNIVLFVTSQYKVKRIFCEHALKCLKYLLLMSIAN